MASAQDRNQVVDDPSHLGWPWGRTVASSYLSDLLGLFGLSGLSGLLGLWSLWIDKRFVEGIDLAQWGLQGRVEESQAPGTDSLLYRPSWQRREAWRRREIEV